jgi:hypothetical protein
MGSGLVNRTQEYGNPCGMCMHNAANLGGFVGAPTVPHRIHTQMQMGPPVMSQSFNQQHMVNPGMP